MPIGPLSVALTLLYIALMLLIAVGMLRRLPTRPPPTRWPRVDLIIAARNEAGALPSTLESVHALRYPGDLTIILVDDRSDDATGALIANAAARDPRVRAVRVQQASRRRAPKVNAILHGIHAGSGEIILTTDADCRLPRDWVPAMVAPFDDPNVVWTLGSVTTRATGEARSFRERFEAIDWLSLMLVSRALSRLGWTLASSANAQAYRRAAFDAVGGFGVAGRAPSGDEELLLQRMGRLPGARAVFVDDPNARVITGAMPSWRSFLRQRQRWVSRYQHALPYNLGFYLGILLLGAHSLTLTLALVTLPRLGDWWAPVLAAWGVKWLIEVFGMRVGLRQLGRADLTGWALPLWALLHPVYIAGLVVASLLQPLWWRGANRRYRWRWMRAVSLRWWRTRMEP